jgi:hypothetical protein
LQVALEFLEYVRFSDQALVRLLRFEFSRCRDIRRTQVSCIR